MKKILLFSIVVLGLAACGPSKDEQAKDEKEAAANVDSLMKMATDAAVAHPVDSTAAPAAQTDAAAAHHADSVKH